MTGPYREQKMTPPPSRWVRFWERMAAGHKHGMGGGYFYLGMTVSSALALGSIVHFARIDIGENEARVQAEYDASHLTGEECATECAGAGMRVDWYKPSTQECGCKQ